MASKITYQQLIDAFSAKTGRTKAFANAFIKDIFISIQEGLRRDENVNIKGLGIFKLQDVAERETVNPKTGKVALIEAHKKVVFKPEKALREKVNAKYEKLQPKRIKKKEPKKASVPEIPLPKEEKIIAKTLPKKEALLFGTADDLPAGEKTAAAPPPKNDKKIMPTFIIEEKKKKSAWRWILPLLLIILLIVLLYVIPVKFESLEKYAFWKFEKDKTETTQKTQTVESELDEIFITAPKPQKMDIQTQVEHKEKIDLTPIQNEEHCFIHIIKPNNTLWGLSVQYYSRASLWPNIYRKNVESLRTPDLLIPGRELLIPELQGDSFQLSKVDSARIAQGYYLAYRSYRKYDPEKAEGYLRVAKAFSTTIE